MENIDDMEMGALEYPRPWTYRVIGTDESLIRQAIAAVLGEQEYELELSNTSSGGKYISMNLETVVASKEARDEIHASLVKNPAVKMVV